MKTSKWLLDDTIEVFTKLGKFFKITNVKGHFEDVPTKDETTAALSSPNDERLNFLLNLGDIVEKMHAMQKAGCISKTTGQRHFLYIWSHL